MRRPVANTAASTWRRLGVPRAEAALMRRELEADLADAAAGGRSPQDYVGGDSRGWLGAGLLPGVWSVPGTGCCGSR